MRTLLQSTLASIAIVLLGISSQVAQNRQQNENANHMTFEVSLLKNEFLPLEPIVAKFSFANETKVPVTSTPPNFFNVKIQSKSRKGTLRIFDISFVNVNRSASPRVFEPGEAISETALLITNLQQLFPEPGVYQLEFILPASSEGEKVLMSTSIRVTILKPDGIDEAALRQLRENQRSSSAPDELFRWTENDKGNEQHESLEAFVDKYQLSVYGDYATLHLANYYLAKNNLQAAKNMFYRASLSRNEFVRERANKDLGQVTDRIANANQENSPDHP